MKSQFLRTLTLCIFVAIFGNHWFQPAQAASIKTLPSSDTVSTFVTIFPQLKTMSAPPAIRAGLRFTYDFVTSGSGGSAAGISQNDVAALDATTALIVQQGYGDNGLGSLVPTSSSSYFELPSVSHSWIHPQILVNAESAKTDVLDVTRTEDSDGAGKIYKVVRFTLTSGNDPQTDVITDWEFDEQSGVLIFYKLQSAAMQAQIRLRSLRQITLPWPAGCRPNWVQTGAKLNYTGGLRLVQPAVGTDGTLPIASNNSVIQATGRWAAWQTDYYFNSSLQSSGFTGHGTGQLAGSYWLPATALAFNPAAPLLDQDPVTGVETLWQRDANNNIVITARTSTWYSNSYYDSANGAMIAVEVQLPVAYGYQITTLQLTNLPSSLSAVHRASTCAGDPPAPTPSPSTPSPTPVPVASPSPHPSPTATRIPVSGAGSSHTYLPLVTR